MDFLAHLEKMTESADMEERTVVKCTSCGAETTLDPLITADDCAFCGEAIVSEAASSQKIKPRALLPFAVTQEQAFSLFSKWVKSRWFAPNALKQYARSDLSRLNGMYVPYWTYDCYTTTFYTGQRGEDYWQTQHYTTRVNGKSVSRTRRVRKTRWYSASGTVFVRFNDILVLASESLPRKYAEKLEPWDLENLKPHDEQYLAGFRAESYQIDLKEGFCQAQQIMVDPIHSTIRDHIGGDRQRIHSTDTQYDDITFKHLLLPVWISAYRFGERLFRFLVNARTGEVQGERPYSWVKITLAAIAGLIIIGAIIVAFVKYQNSQGDIRINRPTPIQLRQQFR